MPKEFSKIDVNTIKEGMRFSAPVFFEDGSNMFLAEGKTVKSYHIIAIKKWGIPFLLTFGHVLNESEKEESLALDEGLEELESLEEL